MYDVFIANTLIRIYNTLLSQMLMLARIIIFYKGVLYMSESKKAGTGLIAGIIACILAVLGILFLGIVFVPLAAIVALIGTIIAVKNKNMAGIGVNVLAWVLVIIGLMTSPILLATLGFAGAN